MSHHVLAVVVPTVTFDIRIQPYRHFSITFTIAIVLTVFCAASGRSVRPAAGAYRYRYVGHFGLLYFFAYLQRRVQKMTCDATLTTACPCFA